MVVFTGRGNLAAGCLVIGGDRPDELRFSGCEQDRTNRSATEWDGCGGRCIGNTGLYDEQGRGAAGRRGTDTEAGVVGLPRRAAGRGIRLRPVRRRTRGVPVGAVP